MTGAEILRTEGHKEGRREGRKQGRREGRKQGLRAGREKGKVEALRTTASRQLAIRFGELPRWATRRIAWASEDQLERWLERLVTARTLRKVFAVPRS